VTPCLDFRGKDAEHAASPATTHGVLILSLGGQVARDLVGSPNTLVNGAALSLFAIASAVVGIAARTLQPRTAMTGGAAASGAGMALLAAAVARNHLPVFLATTAISGAGYSLLFFGGLETINGAAPVEHRGGVLSAIYLLAYVSLAAVSLLLGAQATAHGLVHMTSDMSITMVNARGDLMHAHNGSCQAQAMWVGGRRSVKTWCPHG
jgi:hypothetical protein